MTGRTLSHYRVGEEISRGGMGIVYRATDTRLNREVALKVLPEELTHDPERKRRFIQEAQAASALEHPHIAVIYEVDEADGRSFIAMELIRGDKLSTVLARQPLKAARGLELAIEIASGLARAHERGFVHRDLKPANVMLTDEGHAKIIDFGIAKLIEPAPADTAAETAPTPKTVTGVVLGTTAYMSPEQARGEAVDHRSDIFSFGVLLHEMLTGQRPYQGRTALEIAGAILHQAAPRLPPVGSDVSTDALADMQRIVDKCLAKDPAERYQGMKDLLVDLRAARRRLESSSQPATQMAAATGVPRWRKARLLRVAIALAAAIGLIAAVTLLVVRQRTDSGVRPPATTSGRSTTRLAVLPLQVMSTPESTIDNTYLGIGMADAIITRLANVPGLTLHPTAAVLPYAHRAPDIAAVHAALQVEQVLLGTVQPTATTYRVSLQLVRTGDYTATWAHAYDVPRADLLRLQDSVAEQVADALAIELTAGEREHLRRPATTNAAAYDAYLRGRAQMANFTEAKMRLAIADFEEAVRLDPEFALARAALATTLAWFSVRYAYEDQARDWGQRAELAAQAAFALDPELAEAHLAIANVAGTLHRGFDWRRVIAESKRALDLNPTLELAHQARMRAFYHLGRFDDAREAASRVRLLNPSPNVETDRLLVAIELFDGNYATARDRAQQLLARTDAPAVPNYLGLARFYLGDVEAARAMLASARRGGRPDVRSQAALASVTAAAGRADEARRILDRVLTSGYTDHHVAYSVGATYAQLRLFQESIDWLERAATSGFSCYPWYARDPLLAPLRADPRFTSLLERVRRISASTHTNST